MDLSHLSTEDLKALHAGDLSKMSTEGLQSISGPPAAPAAPSAAPPPQPASPLPTAPAPSPISEGSADLQNLAQGLTWGFGDEASRAIKTHLFGEDPAQADQERTQSNSALQAWNDQNPTDAFVTQGIGGLATGGALAKMLKFAAPGVVNAVTKFAEKSPYLASIGAGGVQGSVYGAGSGEDGSRAEGAATGAAGGAVLGPTIRGVARNIVSPAIEKAGSALEKFLKFNEGDAAAGAEKTAVPATAAPETPQYSDITNKPIVTAPAGGASMLTGNLPLSPGVKAKDANLLRIEDAAKQGNLGPDAQLKIQASDDSVHQTARAALQQLKGATNSSSNDLLESAVTKFQGAAKAAKTQSDELYARRDALMADAVMNKQKVGPSLGANLNDVVRNPKYVAGFKSKSGAAAQVLYDDYKNLITGTPGKELPFTDLAAWRADVSHVAKTDMSTAGTLAKAMGRAYDKWMDNISQDVMISGNPEAASAAKAAASNYAQMKGLYGSKNSPILEGMTKPYDMTPAEFTGKLFGAKGVNGTAMTALNMRKMVKVLPEEHQQEFKNNVFSGMISRIFEGANGDRLKLGNIRNDLSALQKSQVYREQWAKDGSKNTVITNLVKDLTQHIEQTGRKDVISPSGGAIMRGINAILSVPAHIPLVNKIPLVKVPAEIGAKAAELDQNFMDKKAFNSAMKKAALAAHSAARSGPVFDLDALRAGSLGGIVSGETVQMNGKKPKDGLDVKKKESKI